MIIINYVNTLSEQRISGKSWDGMENVGLNVCERKLSPPHYHHIESSLDWHELWLISLHWWRARDFGELPQCFFPNRTAIKGRSLSTSPVSSISEGSWRSSKWMLERLQDHLGRAALNFDFDQQDRVSVLVYYGRRWSEQERRVDWDGYTQEMAPWSHSLHCLTAVAIGIEGEELRREMNNLQ